ncbi:MAG: hypothetical protein IJU91_07925 [Selenomonadaceae bacterium]|nr:hypothetical protein [Selenomonadaceae bacterium]
MKNMPEQKEKSSWDKYKVALIAAVVVLDILLAAIFLTGNDEEKLPAEKNQSQEVQPTVTIEVPAQIVQVPQSDSTPPANVSHLNPADGYPPNQYKIGADIPAGEYLAVGQGYIELKREPTGSSDIVINDNFVNYRYFECRNGEYLRTEGNVKFYPVTADTKIKVDLNKIEPGHYKVGRDIPAGEYKMALESGGHFSVYGNAHDRNILTNGFTNNPETRYVKLSDGQYFQFKKGTATKVN